MSASCNNVSGNWQSVQPFPFQWNVLLTLAQDSSGNISGSGTIQGPGGPITAIQIVPPSTNNYPSSPNVSVTISMEGVGTFTLSGNFTDGTCVKICGSVSGIGDGCIQRV
jgi:hypothetical protein